MILSGQSGSLWFYCSSNFTKWHFWCAWNWYWSIVMFLFCLTQLSVFNVSLSSLLYFLLENDAVNLWTCLHPCQLKLTLEWHKLQFSPAAHTSTIPACMAWKNSRPSCWPEYGKKLWCKIKTVMLHKSWLLNSGAILSPKL